MSGRDSADTLQAALARLRGDFCQRLPGRIEEIESAWRSVRQGKAVRDDLRRLHLLAHSLAGASATFGFAPLSAAARAVEAFVELTPQAGAPPGHAATAQIDALIELLRQSVRAASPGVPTSTDAPPGAGSHGARARRVMLATGDAAFAGMLAPSLHRYGYEVEVVTQSAAMGTVADPSRLGAVLIDLEFAGTGRETALAAWRLDHPAVPIVFLAADGDLPARLRAIRAGAEAYFTRPVDVAAVVDTLDLLMPVVPPEAIRVLVVDDDAALASYYDLVLRQAGMETQVFTDPFQLYGSLAEINPDVILMDLHMPDCTGEELSRAIRQQQAFLGVPIVFLSNETDRARQLVAMHAGGDDFLTKPVDPAHLVSAIAARAARARQLRAYLVRDGLTGLLNHTATNQRLDAELARARRGAGVVTLAMIDIDRFKAVNDTYGHPCGDRVIKSLARLLQQRLRQSDVVGRYGGEEFVVVFADADTGSAAAVLDDVREAFARIRHAAGTTEFSVTFSAGIAAFPAFPDAAAILDAADRALYQAKNAGRNRVVVAAP